MYIFKEKSTPNPWKGILLQIFVIIYIVKLGLMSSFKWKGDLNEDRSRLKWNCVLMFHLSCVYYIYAAIVVEMMLLGFLEARKHNSHNHKSLNFVHHKQ